MISSTLLPHLSGINSRAVGPHTAGLLCTPGAFQPTQVPFGILTVPASKAGSVVTRLINCDTGG